MTTSTTTTTTPATPASPVAPATGGAGAPGATADPAAGALFTALLASMGGSAGLEGAAPAVAADGEATDLGTAEEGVATLAADATAEAAPMPVVPAIVLVPAPAEPALALGGSGEVPVEEAAIATAATGANGLAAAPAAVVGVPVAPAVLLAVADAMPEQAKPLAAEAPVDAEPAPGSTPLQGAAVGDHGPAVLQVPVQTAAPAAVAPPPVAAPATEPAARPLEGRRAERATEAADVAAPAVKTGEGQPNAALAGVTVPTGDAASTLAAPTGASTVDRERFERLVDGLAARLRVSLAGDGARVRMHLTPRELGEVVVRLELKDGLAHAHLIADTREASRMLTAAMGDLRTALADRGVRLDTMDVRVSGDAGGPTQGHAQAQHGRHSHGGERRARMPLTLGPIGGLTAAADLPVTPAEAPAAAGVSVLA